MASNTSVVLSSLDFDTLKTNFKDFLSTQSVFKDYDYSGSNINVWKYPPIAKLIFGGWGCLSNRGLVNRVSMLELLKYCLPKSP